MLRLNRLRLTHNLALSPFDSKVSLKRNRVLLYNLLRNLWLDLLLDLARLLEIKLWHVRLLHRWHKLERFNLYFLHRIWSIKLGKCLLGSWVLKLILELRHLSSLGNKVMIF